jgi:hypothetical protein
MLRACGGDRSAASAPDFMSEFHAYELVFLYNSRMSRRAISQLRVAVDALAAEELPWLLADDLIELQRLRSGLDAQIARRVRAFDRSKEWVLAGARTPGAWLQRECRMSSRDATAEVSVARQVDEMPAVADAWQSGAINSGHVEVLASTRRGARADERFAEFEDAFLAVAEAGSPKDVATVAQHWRDALDAERQSEDSLAAQQYESRHLDMSETLDRRLYLNGFADGETGSVISRAVDNEVEAQRHANDDRTPGQLRIDALAAICERDLDRLPLGSNRPHVGVIGDVGTVMSDHVGLAETDTGVRLAPEALRRIACDAFVSTAAVDANSAVLDMGRAVRSFTPAQRRAISIQYPSCAFPGCAIPTSRCRMHHLDWWDDDGPTDLGNGIPLCRHHHHLPHELGWHVERHPMNGIVSWYRPDSTAAGETHPRTKPPPIPLRRPDHRIAALQREGWRLAS